MTNASQNLDDVFLRLQALEAERGAEKDVRLCMNQYMALCDNLDVGFDLSILMILFSKDAVWQGVGKRYGKTFGRYEGRDAITEMFSKYIKEPAHFMLNAHFLCNELIEVDVKALTAIGRWMLIQPSTFSSGKSQLSAAHISADFVYEDDAWVISSFTTKNLFSRPMAEQWDDPTPLSVPSKASTEKKKTSTQKVAKKATEKTDSNKI